MKPRGRTFSRPAPTKAFLRAALRSLLVMREKPLSDADKVSLSRSYGMTVAEIESVAADVKRRRA